jgi:hypothetical protein
MLPVFPGGFPTAPLVAGLSGATDPTTGLVTLALQVPNNLPGVPAYGGLNPTGNGRFVLKAHLFFDNPTAGDKILGAFVSDSASLMPAGDQALFPGYPILASLIDPCVPSGEQIIPIDHVKGSVDIESNGQVFIPAGIFLVVVAKTATPRADNFNGSVVWLCQVPQD